ncbi:related to F1F0 ATPase complex assembly protein [Cephalotrichum gorgonifer]|uniref:Related to F1F0 ATPase complex assembly protein n=1 Tax=Cephalotrichum gorgonifer TaxID=2041049 RepID=A0AAE8MQW8_9PEZI|nr:related to F1F0 ATPase complex assembly protein [Cephalotrichum gorgonifer]
MAPHHDEIGQEQFHAPRTPRLRDNTLPHSIMVASGSRAALALFAPSRRPLTCLVCQWHRAFTVSARRSLPETKPPAVPKPDSAAPARKPTQPADPLPAGAAIDAPRSWGKRVDSFTPKPLPRPIGMNEPPVPGENTGLDFRTIREKRDDFVNYDRHLIKRKQLKERLSRPYFRDWTNLQHHDGKSFIAPPRLFRADKALYFPNLYGQTLLRDGVERDTTPQLYGRASVVTIFSSRWAELQADSFVSEAANPALHALLRDNPDAAQIVRINAEDNALKAWLVRRFMGSLRKTYGEENHGRYFLVRRGVTDLIRESIGLLNGKVGYTYLVDAECRIRWAASGASLPEEVDSMTKGMQKLIREAQEMPSTDGELRKLEEMDGVEDTQKAV